uniref:Uncharacterized protein n=1 Tax=Meloidogyne enterolobii TaxID=390850 RepID=A0A6V7VJT3_MELEN|nr:unnamed protein product [Meloidogyne enterolobii]
MFAAKNVRVRLIQGTEKTKSDKSHMNKSRSCQITERCIFSILFHTVTLYIKNDYIPFNLSIS